MLALARREPSLIAIFQSAGAPVALQRDAEMVRPDRHAELPGQVIHDIVGGRTLAMRLHCLQRGVAQRYAGFLLAAPRLAGSTCSRGASASACRTASPPPSVN